MPLSLNRLFSLISGLIALILLGWLVCSQSLISNWDFRNNLWAPSYLLLHHSNPFDISVLFDNSNAVWFPPIVGFLAPILGLLPLQVATNCWFLLNIILLVVMVWWVGGHAANLAPRLKLAFFAIALVLVFLFPPTITHLVLGQFTIIDTMIFLGIGRLLDKNLPSKYAWLVSGALIVVATAKPQLLVLVLPGTFIYLYFRQGGLKPVGYFLAGITGTLLIFSLPLWWGCPDWIPDFFQALQKNPHWEQPSLFQISQNLFGEVGFGLWLVLAVLIFGLNIWLWLTRTASEAVMWSMSLTLLVSPYIWSWDFVLILPLLVSFIFSKANVLSKVRFRTNYSLFGISYLFCWIGMIWQRLYGDASDQLSWWVPLVLFVPMLQPGLLNSVSRLKKGSIK